ncbi:MAG: CRISPR-associated helicase Cas3' [Immundisolibacterales bacterium]|nr:CRISPR-associated helicase Cas3' [Immundisolibacterales bacterium]
MIDDLLRFWGKARPRDPAPAPTWHPLAYHALDVAAVGEALLMQQRGPGGSLPDSLGFTRDITIRVVCFLLCLHDIGKFARKFQAKVPNLYPSHLGDVPADLSIHFDHGAGGLRLFDAAAEAFKLPIGARPDVWRPLISAVTGHHGSPPDPGSGRSLVALRSDFGQAGIGAAHEFIQRVRPLFRIPENFPVLDRPRARRASHALAGLAVLADWIGSNQDWFPYREPNQDLDSHWRGARAWAARAVTEAAVVPAGVGRHLEYTELIGSGTVPSPMQEWTRSVELPAGPALFMIEDETGSGKTEAALMLAHRLMQGGRADGVYVALPTMATANAMFERLAAVYRRLFSAECRPSIVLAHGARELHQGFQAALPRGGRVERPYSNGDGTEEPSETTASAACAAWIADDRRKAFLADAGAGTIDQAILAVLPSRHQSLRLLGLMRRVLILDEVHAYDAYMQREMERLLEFQAGLGGSAILLSATLPLSIRRRLTDAFAKGLDGDTGAGDDSMDYPLATVCAGETRFAKRVAGQAGRARSLPVRFLRSPDDALEKVERAARAGNAVLYIRNTVDDALDAHAALASRGLAPGLFHARYALVDRLNIENRVVEAFGRRSTRPGRSGRILVATQVVEQSLDLDFDTLVTDLAPIDLLIQRAGRLWRHDRPEREGRPELIVVGPEPVKDADEKWFSRAFPRTAYVYRDHARLWLTARVLENAGAITSPGGLRTLVESVYGEEAGEGIPADLQGSLFETEGRAGADRGVATANLLDFTAGYVRDGGAWEVDVRTPTRLDDDPSVTLRLARVRDGRVEPYALDSAPEEAWRAWRLSEASVSARRVTGEAVPAEHAEAARSAKADWNRYDSDKILVVLDQADCAGGSWSGAVASGGSVSFKKRLRYDSSTGLTWMECR